jgi:hypothetical protein
VYSIYKFYDAVHAYFLLALHFSRTHMRATYHYIKKKKGF